jgi:hypothetical protein
LDRISRSEGQGKIEKQDQDLKARFAKLKEWFGAFLSGVLWMTSFVLYFASNTYLLA